ncbi:hypothetical protein [Serratia fonticola]
MADLPETPGWEASIKQLEQDDMAEGGANGIANLQATQLANRTQFLKAGLESIPDYREFTFFITESDPDGTIAGLAATESGQYFRVAQGASNGFKYYLNNNGVALEVSETVGSAAIAAVLAQLQNSNIGPEWSLADLAGRTDTFIENGNLTTRSMKIMAGEGDGVWYSDSFGRRYELAKKNNGIMLTENDGLSTSTISIEPNDSNELTLGDGFGRRKIVGSSTPVPEPEASTWLKDAIASMELVALQSRNAVLSRGNNIARLIAGYIIFLFTGQSLSNGTEANPRLSRMQSLDNKMIGNSVMPESPVNPAFVPRGGSVLTPLIGTSIDKDGKSLTDEQVAQLEPGTISYGESPAVAAVNGLRRHYLDAKNQPSDQDKIFIAAASGVGGRTIAQLSKGAVPNIYQRNVDAMNIAKSLADTEGRTFQVGAFTDIQGENDYPNTEKADYKEAKLKFFDDLQSDRPSNPDGRLTAIFTVQSGASFTRDNRGLSIGMAQLEISNERDDVFMIGGYYPYTNVVSGHLDSNGSRNLGDKAAEVKFRVLVLGQDWKPMQAIAAIYRDTDAIIAMHTPVTPIRFAAPRVGSVEQSFADKGITALDEVNGGYTPIPILSVERAATSCLHVKLATKPVGNLVFRYADQVHGGNGMVCDSSNGLSTELYTYLPDSGMLPAANIPELVGKPYDRRNWSVAFQITATEV